MNFIHFCEANNVGLVLEDFVKDSLASILPSQVFFVAFKCDSIVISMA